MQKLAPTRHKLMVAVSLALLVMGGMGFLSWQRGAPVAGERAYPARVRNPQYEGFDWIAATELVDESGLLRGELVRELGRAALTSAFYEASAAKTAGLEPLPCFVTGRGHGHYSPRRPQRATLNQIVDQTEFMFRGTVVSREGGFGGQSMAAMTVLEVRVDEWLIVSPRYPASDTVHVLYPAGNFSLGELEICGHTDGMSPAPNVGDEVLMFPTRTSWDYWEEEGRDWPFVQFTDYGIGVHAGTRGEPARMVERLRIPGLGTGLDFESIVGRFRGRAEARERRQ